MYPTRFQKTKYAHGHFQLPPLMFNDFFVFFIRINKVDASQRYKFGQWWLDLLSVSLRTTYIALEAEEVLAEVFVGVQCCLGVGQAV